jgi:hypothetical protein
MSYSFRPMTEEEINNFGLIENGIYDFEIISSNRKTSKAGNQMAELCLNVWDKKGKMIKIFDYLIFSSLPFNIRKIKHFCNSVGLQKEYEKGEIPEELKGLSGKVEIGIKEGEPIPFRNGEYYPKKNIVVDFVQIEKINSINEQIKDDDLPF